MYSYYSMNNWTDKSVSSRPRRRDGNIDISGYCRETTGWAVSITLSLFLCVFIFGFFFSPAFFLFPLFGYCGSAELRLYREILKRVKKMEREKMQKQLQVEMQSYRAHKVRLFSTGRTKDETHIYESRAK